MKPMVSRRSGNLDLACSVISHDFDEIIEGRKLIEVRQFETITVKDDLGRTIILDVDGVEQCVPDGEGAVEHNLHSDEPLNDDLPIFKIKLGRVIRQTKMIKVCLLREQALDIAEWEEILRTSLCPRICSGCRHLFVNEIDVGEATE